MLSAIKACLVGGGLSGPFLPHSRRGQRVLAQFALSYRETIQSWSLLLSLHSALDLDWRIHVALPNPDQIWRLPLRSDNGSRGSIPG